MPEDVTLFEIQLTVEGSRDNLFSTAIHYNAPVAKLVDAQDLKSWDPYRSCQFKSGPGHQIFSDKVAENLVKELKEDCASVPIGRCKID